MKKYLRQILYALSIFCVVVTFAACSSPENDGIDAANRFKECDDNYVENLTKAFAKFVENFDDYDFTTRVEARQKIESIIDDENERYNKEIKNAEKQYLELKKKYMKDREKSTSFEYAYQQQMAIVKQETLHDLPSQEIINEKILTIIPPKPEADKIQVDLIGRRFVDKPDGYFSGRKFIITEGEVENLEIRSAADEKGRYKINAIVTLREHTGGVAFLVDLDILYMLGTADDWAIDGVSANSINILKENTELLRQYIKIEPDNSWSDHYYIVNYSDALLLIAGTRYYITFNGYIWEKFSIEVAGNDRYSLGCKDLEIHFIERR